VKYCLHLLSCALSGSMLVRTADMIDTKIRLLLGSCTTNVDRASLWLYSKCELLKRRFLGDPPAGTFPLRMVCRGIWSAVVGHLAVGAEHSPSLARTTGLSLRSFRSSEH
jgi:hypothetical protein